MSKGSKKTKLTELQKALMDKGAMRRIMTPLPGDDPKPKKFGEVFP